MAEAISGKIDDARVGSHARVFCCGPPAWPWYRRPMRTASRHGFTLLEVALAVVLLTVGVGALMGAAVLTVRTTIRGRQTARVTYAAASQLELLREIATTRPAYCGGLLDGVDSSADGTSWRWQVRPAGDLREVAVTASVPVPGGRLTDSLVASIWCR